MTKPKFTICKDRHCNATNGHDNEIQIYQQIHRQTGKRTSAPRSPSWMLDRQKPDVWLRGANIETGGGREGGKNVSVNGILQPNACEN
jgi:hypothetical protein